MTLRIERQSNIELLRIIAMFLVLLVHADFWSLGEPTIFDFKNTPVDASLRVFFQSLSVSCVDIFILISGWFGIKPKIKGICNFLFQCCFYLWGIYLVAIILGTAEFTINGIKGCIAATEQNWFIRAYLLLYILSPILNSFVETASKNLFRNVLISFFLFEVIYGWLFSKAGTQFNGGYSTISFVGLYLLARYVRLHKPTFSLRSYKFDLAIISLCVFGVFIVYITPPLLFNNQLVIGSKLLSYISPSTIIISIFSLLLFSKIRIQNSIINKVAASSFAVFLIHTNPNIRESYRELFINLHIELSTSTFWISTLFILIVIFFISILVDQLRILAWKAVLNKYKRLQ
jgi:surface polysaccharide O-acyltransferase-like enzyme